MTDVFISYKREDRKRIEQIAASLEKEGLEVWYDARLDPNQAFTAEIHKVTQDASAVLVCWTKAAMGSDWVTGEALVGKERGVLVSLMLEPCQLRPPFNVLHAEDLSGWSGDANHKGWKKLVARLKALQTGKRVSVTPAASLSPKQKLTPAQAEKQIWEQTKADNSYAAYTHYLDLYPTGKHTAEIQTRLGTMFYDGDGVTQDFTEARSWYSKAIEKDNDEAQFRMGIMCEQGAGVEQNDAKATSWFRKAATQGHAAAQYHLGAMYYYGAGIEADLEQSRKWVKKSADRGYIDGLVLLGFMYYSGEGGEKDLKKSTNVYRKAASQGDPTAQARLGNMYNKGEGVKKDFSTALSWFRKSAKQDNIEGQENLAFMYLRGNGVTQNATIAADWFTKAAQQGASGAQYQLGLMYEGGIGLGQNSTKAASWYRKAADQENTGAQAHLGQLNYSGNGVEQNYEKAAQWISQAAKKNDSTAQSYYGQLYFYGHGTEQDYSKAKLWLEKAANQGDAVAQRHLAQMHQQGYGAPVNVSAAVDLFKQAAQNGDMLAQYNLAQIYQSGDGLPQDISESAIWYYKAAQQDHPEAQNILGNMYLAGEGVTKNADKAVRWYRKSASHNNCDAPNNLGKLYETGEGVEQDYAKALSLYQGALGNDGAAEFYIGQLHEHGRGIKQNISSALKFYSKSIKLNYQPALSARKSLKKRKRALGRRRVYIKILKLLAIPALIYTFLLMKPIIFPPAYDMKVLKRYGGSPIFSPDGKYIASSATFITSIGKVALWDTATGERLHIFDKDKEVSDFEFSPDGKQLAISYWSGATRLWNTQTRKVEFTLKDEPHWSNNISYSPNGNYLATKQAIWNPLTGEKIANLSDAMSNPTYGPNGKYLITRKGADQITVWNADTRKKTSTLGESSDDYITSFEFSPDSKHIVTGSSGMKGTFVRLWNVKTGNYKDIGEGEYAVFSHDGKYLVTGGGESMNKSYKLSLFDVSTGKLIKTFKGDTGQLTDLAMSPNNRFVATGGYADTVILWDLESGQKLVQLHQNNGFFSEAGRSLAFSSNSSHIVAEVNFKARVWDISTIDSEAILKDRVSNE